VKCTIVGVEKASISLVVVRLPDSAIRAITTNCNPVRAAAEEPMRKKNVSQAASGEAVSMTVNRKW